MKLTKLTNRIISSVALSFLLISCNSGELKHLNEQVDSLQKVVDSLTVYNAQLQKELDGYKQNPAKVLADIQQDYSEKNYSSIKTNLDLLKQYHPESQEYTKAKSIYDQSLTDQELARKKAEQEAAKAEAARRAKMAPIERIMEKYGCDEDIATLILHKQVRRGMTAEQCRAAWGRPEDINRTTGSYGVHEQWCYGGHNYLYFEDGILTTIQN